MENESMTSSYPRRQKRSACANLSLAQEQARVRGMSVEARMKAALTMKSRFAWINPRKKDD